MVSVRSSSHFLELLAMSLFASKSNDSLNVIWLSPGHEKEDYPRFIAIKVFLERRFEVSPNSSESLYISANDEQL